MSTQEVDDLREQINRLMGTRKLDRIMQWVSGIGATVAAAGFIAAASIIWNLQIDMAVSSAKVEAAISSLHETIDTSSVLRVAPLERAVDDIRSRLRVLEAKQLVDDERRGAAPH